MWLKATNHGKTVCQTNSWKSINNGVSTGGLFFLHASCLPLHLPACASAGRASRNLQNKLPVLQTNVVDPARALLNSETLKQQETETKDQNPTAIFSFFPEIKLPFHRSGLEMKCT